MIRSFRRVTGFMLATTLFTSAPAFAAPPAAAPVAPSPATASVSTAATPTKPDLAVAQVVGLSNQMMITFMERFKAGAFDKCREIAQQMILGEEKYQDTATQEFKAFNNPFEKMLRERRLQRNGQTLTVNWVQQPIADGHYFLALLALQAGDPEKAAQEIDRAVFWNPVRAAFFNEKAFILLNQKTPRLQDAQVAYLFALELADNLEDFAAALRGLGFIYVEKNEADVARACYLQSMVYEPKNEAARGQLALLTEHFPGIAERVTPADAPGILAKRQIPSKIDPLPIQLLSEMAGRVSLTSNKRDVLAILKRILTLDPSNAKVRQQFEALGGK